MGIPVPSPAVLNARNRRTTADAARVVRWEWFIKNVSDKVSLTMTRRLTMATQYLLTKVTQNISRPVTKGVGPRGGRIVLDRSLPGEYPKADSTQLLKTVFSDIKQLGGGNVEGFIGTPLDYGLILETRLNRSFLVRTLNEERAKITKLLTGPIT